MPLVAVTDYTFPSLGIEEGLLQPLGLTVAGAQCRTPADLIEFLHDADYVITQFAPVNAEVIAACDEAGVSMVMTGRRHFRH